MTNLATTQAQIREITRDLDAIRFRLLGVLAILPPTAAELNSTLKLRNGGG